MSRLFRRALTTLPPPPAGPSTASTAPLAVRRRRLEHPHAVQPSPLTSPESFIGPDAERFPPRMEEEFQALRARGAFKGEEMEARAAFLSAQALWKARVRGGRGVATKMGGAGKAFAERKLDFLEREGVEAPLAREEDTYRDAITGTKIFLPNIQIRLMRNHTPPGEAYDPWVATFRIPPSMTKTDLRSYLHAVYGLDVTFIRTDNYVAPTSRFMGGQIRRENGSKKNYKRAVVGLTEPFHYPDDIEELRAGTYGGPEKGAQFAAEREEAIEGEFAIEQAKNYRKALTFKMHKGWRWRSATHDNAGNTIREIMRRRAEREEAIAAAANHLQPRPDFPELAEGEAAPAPTA